MQKVSFNSSANSTAVVIDGVRTPFVKSFGAFAQCDALELFSRVIDGLLRKSEVDASQIEEVSCGVVIPQTKNPNVARDAVLNLGMPHSVTGYTLNRACTSSLQTISNAACTIRSNVANLTIAGGVECLSNVPITYSDKAQAFLIKLSRARTLGQKLALLKTVSFRDWLPTPPALAEPMTGLTMGQHAEIMAKNNDISREQQDHFAFGSHKKAYKAQQDGLFKDEIIPVWSERKIAVAVEQDDVIRPDASEEAMAKLKPAFDKKYGTITPANSSPLTDGAAACLIGEEKYCVQLGLKPKSRIVDFCYVAVDPQEGLLIGPAIAIPLILDRNSLKIEDIGLFELHEAFAAQVLSCIKCMESSDFNEKHFGRKKPYGTIPREKLNVNGGAIAIGHPFGATGARLVTTLGNELQRRKQRYGLIGVCAAGGMAAAMIIENCQF
ncbi:MAG: acetyl-CoA C-acyltransferase [Oligoflexales bacterium]